MSDWLTDTVLLPLAEEIAQELGIQVPGGTMAKMAGSFITTEALKSSLDFLLPFASSGISFSTTGITLAVIQHKLREVNKKLDLLLDSGRKTAKDKIAEALIALEHGNFADAAEEFKKACDKATEAYHTCQDNDSRLTCARIKMFSQMMTKCYDATSKVFLPFSKLSSGRKKELAGLLKVTLDTLLKDLESEKPEFVDTLLMKAKTKKKKLEAKLNEILITTYPILSEGLQWSQPMEPIQEFADVLIIHVYPEYLPVGDACDFKLPIGRNSEGQPIKVLLSHRGKKQDDRLFVEKVSFPITEDFDNEIMLEFFAKRMMPFRDDKLLFLCAARAGRSQYLLSVLKKHETFDVNLTNFKGEFALGLAARNGHTYIVEILVDMSMTDPTLEDVKGNTALHEAAMSGNCQSIQILFSALSLNDINRTNLEGETPLMIACDRGHAQAVDILLENGANIQVKRKDGSTALHLAAANGHAVVVELLLKWQADKTAIRSSDGTTPLYMASSRGHVEVVKALLKRSSKFELKSQPSNIGGLTPGQVAQQHGHTEIYNLLKKYGLS